jgi:hypothetical protein
MRLQLRYPDVRKVLAGVPLPGAKPNEDGADEVRLIYEVCDLDGQRLTCRGGRYEKSNQRSGSFYREHAEEAALRAKLQAAVGVLYQIRAVPVPSDGGAALVYFEAVRAFPLTVDMECAD